MAEASTVEKAASSGHGLAGKWLGVCGTYGGRDAIRALIAKASPARAQHIALVVALAAIEERTGVQTWRTPGREAACLSALETWGYDLSPVEQIARGPKLATKSTTTKSNSATRPKAGTTKPAPKATTKPVAKKATTA